MAKFYGKIGFVVMEETSPGVYMPNETEHEYFGDLTRSRKRYESSGGVNDDVNITNEISIKADPFAGKNCMNMKYVQFIYPPIGGRWKITDIDVQYPNLILTVGGLYNG